MNQILIDDNSNDYNKRASGSGGYKRNSEPMDIDTILKIYVVIAIIFGVLLIGKGVYALTSQADSNVSVSKEESTVQILLNHQPQEEGDKIQISITSQTPIDKIVYRWNDGSERTIKGNNQTSLQQLIDCPNGKNTLYVQAIDTAGGKKEANQEFTTENGIDINNPEIKLELTEDKKLRITATDDTNLAYITYRWNQEEEQKVETEDENQVKIEAVIDILKGENDLTVVAVDGKGNSTTKSQQFIGRTVPEIQVNTSTDGSKLIIKVSHENGLKRIYYTLNDKPYEANFTDSPKVFEFEQALDRGYNRIIMEVTSVDETKNTFDGQCNY